MNTQSYMSKKFQDRYMALDEEELNFFEEYL